MISIEKLNKYYGKYRALTDLDLDITEGSITGLLGPNGAGKTTLIRILNQITQPDTGTIYFNGEKLQNKHLSQIGYLPEERGLYKKMKVGEQLLYLVQLRGLNKTESVAKLKHWFEKFEIVSWWDKTTEELSKGMAQKIQFIVAVLHNPKFLILDEPFSGFDPVNAEVVKNEILELNKQGTTILFSTHRMESVEEMCSHIALINKSQIALKGKTVEVKNQFRSQQFSAVLKNLPHHLHPEIAIKSSETDFITGYKKIILETGLQVSNRELLQWLAEQSEVIAFNEVIPTMNDIFLKIVGTDILPENNG